MLFRSCGRKTTVERAVQREGGLLCRERESSFRLSGEEWVQGQDRTLYTNPDERSRPSSKRDVHTHTHTRTHTHANTPGADVGKLGRKSPSNACFCCLLYMEHTLPFLHASRLVLLVSVCVSGFGFRCGSPAGSQAEGGRGEKWRKK